MDKKCLNCGKISPIRTEICDKCGSMKFKPITEEKAKEKILSQELIDQEIRIKKVKESDHLCDNCELEFATCESKPIFGIDIEETLTGEDADTVIECNNFKEQEDDKEIKITEGDINPEGDCEDYTEDKEKLVKTKKNKIKGE